MESGNEEKTTSRASASDSDPGGYRASRTCPIPQQKRPDQAELQSTAQSRQAGEPTNLQVKAHCAEGLDPRCLVTTQFLAGMYGTVQTPRQRHCTPSCEALRKASSTSPPDGNEVERSYSFTIVIRSQ
eukprot:scaffold1504_cov417-Prasinococcus_capsulatus_cf.AAC.42